MTKYAGFNRLLSNALRRIVQRNGGEFHGSFWQVAEALQLEVGGIVMEEQVIDMKLHVLDVGGDALVDGTDLVFFRDSLSGDLNFVEKELMREPGS